MSRHQKSQFIESVVSDSLLDDAIGWIKDNLSIIEVFGQQGLKDECEQDQDPDEVFSEKKLRQWALKNGFVEEEG